MSKFGNANPEPVFTEAPRETCPLCMGDACEEGCGLGGAPCFVCGIDPGRGVQMDMACFVDSKEEGERAIELIWSRKGHALLDYRDYEPNRVQVKLGACGLHEPNLRALHATLYSAVRGGGVKSNDPIVLTPTILDKALPRLATEDPLDVIVKTLGSVDQAREMLEGLSDDEVTRFTRPYVAQGIIDALHKAGFEVVARG